MASRSSDTTSSSNEAIVPSLDGRLYWRPPTAHGDDEEGALPLLQELPLTVSGLLDHPVRSCDDNNEECGILTAHTTTSLIALSDTGSLLWKTAPDDDVEAAKEQQKTSHDGEHPTLLLQRKDYWIQNVQAKTGEQSWNASLGMFSALDFELSPPDDEEHDSSFLLDDDGVHEKQQLPSIFFSNAGRTVTAMDPETRAILWRQDVPTTLSSVFGIARGQWQTVHVLQQPALSYAMTGDHQRPPRLFLPSPSSDYNADYYEGILWSLHQQQVAEQKKKAAAKIKALPATNQKRNHQCFVDVDGSIQCPQQLRLPAPEVVAPHPPGIFLSWSLVASLLSTFFILGGLFVLRWQRRRQKHQKQQLEEESSIEKVPAIPIPPSPELSPFDSTSHIPLVRYSRYASEFLEKQKLGKGGFGSVFECQNMLDGRLYAVKKVIIAGNAREYKHHLQRVLREVKILAVLDHPHIVRYYTAWLEEHQQGDQENDDTSSRMVEESSSRWMESDSVSEWTENNNTQPRSRSTYSRRYHRNSTADLPRRDLRNDDFMIFEDESKENVATTNGEKLPTDQHLGISESETGNDEIPLDGSNERKRHMLYIQMQLCTQRTVTEFLSDPRARQDSMGDVDISKALQLFLQIAEAVQHVHKQGLIHRDLKPSNCFMDDTMSVKVGDFGLSRESTADDAEDIDMSSSFVEHEDHTAGVGTRSYASPEQMNGSDYDASTDVYSLGIILFELLYPMYTGMERSICLSKLRDGEFPRDWEKVVGRSEMSALISSMVTVNPSHRPTANVVAKQIASILGEYTIVSLQNYTNAGDDIVLLRLEAKEDSLRETMQWIRQEADIVEYGLRVQGSNSSIMEFALQNVPDDLIHKLRRRPDIDKVREVSTTSSSSRSKASYVMVS